MNQKVVYSLFAVSSLIVLFILGYITSRTIGVDAKFWENFWPNFWSDLIVGIIVATIISWAITKSKRMEAGIIANAKELEADVIANETSRDGATHFIRFAVRNTCDHCFSNEGIYWHLFIEEKAYIRVLIP
jgi:uncharacterized membrane-anchored protein YitT (DUF2179 family)